MFALSSNIIEDCKNTLQKHLVDQIFFEKSALKCLPEFESYAGILKVSALRGHIDDQIL